MQVLILNTYSGQPQHTLWHKVIWLTAVALTLGLCLVAWKRPATEAAVSIDSTTERVAPLEVVRSTPVKMVVKVRQIKLKPVWASALFEVELMEEEYPQVATRSGA